MILCPAQAADGNPARAALAQGIYLLDKGGSDEEILQRQLVRWKASFGWGFPCLSCKDSLLQGLGWAVRFWCQNKR